MQPFEVLLGLKASTTVDGTPRLGFHGHLPCLVVCASILQLADMARMQQLCALCQQAELPRVHSQIRRYLCGYVQMNMPSQM